MIKKYIVYDIDTGRKVRFSNLKKAKQYQWARALTCCKEDEEKYFVEALDKHVLFKDMPKSEQKEYIEGFTDHFPIYQYKKIVKHLYVDIADNENTLKNDEEFYKFRQ